VRLPRDFPRGKLRISVGLVALADGRLALTDRGEAQVILPVEVAAE
jgi:hypothetical protein